MERQENFNGEEFLLTKITQLSRFLFKVEEKSFSVRAKLFIWAFCVKHDLSMGI